MNNQLKLPINEHFHIRHTVPADAEETFALIEKNRTYLRQWLPWVDATHTVADCIENLEKLQEPNANPEFTLVFHDQIVGRLGFHEVDHTNRSASIGYWLAAEHQGHGLMKQAVQAALNHAFNTLNLHRIVIKAGVDNQSSRAVPERLGFHFEGIARDAEWLHDQFIDFAVYSMLSCEFSLTE